MFSHLKLVLTIIISCILQIEDPNIRVKEEDEEVEVCQISDDEPEIPLPKQFTVNLEVDKDKQRTDLKLMVS